MKYETDRINGAEVREKSNLISNIGNAVMHGVELFKNGARTLYKNADKLACALTLAGVVVAPNVGVNTAKAVDSEGASNGSVPAEVSDNGESSTQQSENTTNLETDPTKFTAGIAGVEVKGTPLRFIVRYLGVPDQEPGEELDFDYWKIDKFGNGQDVVIVTKNETVYELVGNGYTRTMTPTAAITYNQVTPEGQNIAGTITLIDLDEEGNEVPVLSPLTFTIRQVDPNSIPNEGEMPCIGEDGCVVPESLRVRTLFGALSSGDVLASAWKDGEEGEILETRAAILGENTGSFNPSGKIEAGEPIIAYVQRGDGTIQRYEGKAPHKVLLPLIIKGNLVVDPAAPNKTPLWTR